MTKSVIARLEALSGPMPNLEPIERYIDACEGQLALFISDKRIAIEDACSEAFAKEHGSISSDIELGIEDLPPRQKYQTEE